MYKLLRHLLEDSQALLDDGHLLGVANKRAVLLDHSLRAVEVGEVVGAIEVVKSAEGRDSTPVVKRRATSRCNIIQKLVFKRREKSIPRDWGW